MQKELANQADDEGASRIQDVTRTRGRERSSTKEEEEDPARAGPNHSIVRVVIYSID